MDTIPVLLDTDIGSDIDDAVALAYLLSQPRCELLGITTVTGEPHKRASLADAVCRVAGRTDIPIHVGVEAPLLVMQNQPQASQFEALTERWPHSEFAQENTAISFLRETIRSRPGEITLLAIGPLTNIALLFALDPEIPSLLKRMVIMGGQFFGAAEGGLRTCEWNMLCDPHAAAMVFAAPLPSLTAVGLDVTTQCVLPADECRHRFSLSDGPLKLVGEMAEVWFRGSKTITFHDPLAAALLFAPSLCETVPAHVAVELVSPLTPGQTVLQAEPPLRHQVARTVDTEAFFTYFFETVG
ncbi:MAG: nucleoside hydrolase [Janthinobacterium lividum]